MGTPSPTSFLPHFRYISVNNGLDDLEGLGDVECLGGLEGLGGLD